MALIHDTNQYQIPRGRVYFDPFDANGNPTGEREFGNCPGFSVSVETTNIDHYASTGGLREKDGSWVLEVNRSGALTCDNLSGANVALFLSGEEDTVSQTNTAVTDETIKVIPGRTYQLGKTTANPAGHRNVSAVVVTNSAGTTTYVLGTDYALDAALGRLQILASGTIVAGDIKVDYAKPAATWARVKTGSKSELSGALRVIADNAAGENRDWYMPKVTLTPNGELPIISDATDVASMEFTVEVLKPANGEAIYIDGRPA